MRFASSILTEFNTRISLMFMSHALSIILWFPESQLREAYRHPSLKRLVSAYAVVNLLMPVNY